MESKFQKRSFNKVNWYYPNPNMSSLSSSSPANNLRGPNHRLLRRFTKKILVIISGDKDKNNHMSKRKERLETFRKKVKKWFN